MEPEKELSMAHAKDGEILKTNHQSDAVTRIASRWASCVDARENCALIKGATDYSLHRGLPSTVCLKL